MKKSLLLGITGITLVALTATTLYAQTVAGTSIVNKMKAAVADFTLSTVLNPGETGLKSAPIAGKKTGGILTAGEWNRVLELVSEGSSGSCTPSASDVYDSGWVSFTRGQEITLTHNLGTLDTMVYLEYKAGPSPDTAYLDPNALNSLFLNHASYIYWNEKTENTIKLLTEYNAYDVGIRYFKVVMWKKSAFGTQCGGGGTSSGGTSIIEWGIIKTSAKTISNWDLITLEWSWNSGGGDAAPTGGYIYKLNGQPKLSYVEASGISKDVTLTTTAQTVHNLSVRLSGDSVIIDPSSSNTLAYIVWKFSGGSSTWTSSSTGIGTPDYQSDWIDFGLAGNPVKKKFTHNLGTENYMIQMEGKGPGGDNNNCPSFIGADSSNSWLMNSGYWYYYDKTSTSVSVANYTNSLGRCSRYIRIKLWKHAAPTIAPASTVTNA